MIEDILNLPKVIEICKKEYKIEYDCKAYALLEAMTGKSTLEIKNKLENSVLGLMDSIEVICCGLVKHHTDDEIKEVREHIKNNLFEIQKINIEVMIAFLTPLAPPEMFETYQKAFGKIKEFEKSAVKKKRKSKK